MWFAEEPAYYNQNFNGKGWSIIFCKGKESSGGTYLNDQFLGNKEITICARHWNTAQQASNLIYASLILERGDTMNGNISTQPVVYSEQEDMPHKMPKRIFDLIKNNFLITPSLSDACLIAVKASKSKHVCYAISKYKLSCEIYSPATIDLDPFHSENMKLSPFIEDHVLFSTSITLSYSAIEDLKLNLKASPQNPSKLSNGEWNPIVKNDLEQRLIKAGIDINEPLLWAVRGTPRKIDKLRPPIAVSKPYKSSKTVRDVEVRLIDALNDARWLRSKVATHGSTHLTPSLSPYDVANVQHLTRRLILESLGYWKYMYKKNKKHSN